MFSLFLGGGSLRICLHSVCRSVSASGSASASYSVSYLYLILCLILSLPGILVVLGLGGEEGIGSDAEGDSLMSDNIKGAAR